MTSWLVNTDVFSFICIVMISDAFFRDKTAK